jgi:hypothetical protein
MEDGRHDIRVYLQPAFLICVAVLAVAAGGMSVAVKRFGLYLKKEPLPLKKSLDLLDETKLAPYEVISKQKIENEEILKELGTEDYIQWVLQDPEAPADSAAAKILLFITYYRLPDRVPHVPEECYTGGGYQRLASESVTFEIGKPGLEKTIEGRYLVFGSTTSDFWQSGGKFPVIYLFKVNGEYANTRNEARIILNKNIFRKHSYFCKIELVFNQALIAPTKEEAMEASGKLLSKILPILETEHWPDW